MKRLLAIVLLASMLVSQGFGASAREKSGVFLGLETDTSFGTARQFFNLVEFLGFRAPASTSEIRALLGFQVYFTPSFGFDVRARVGTGRMAFRNYDYDYRLTSLYSAINTGGEVKLLWDFYNDEEDSMGMSLGVSYDYFKATHIMASTHMPNPIPENLPMMHKFNIGVLAPVIGLHYYFGHHQIAFTYHMGRVMDKLPIPLPPRYYFGSSFSYVYRF